MYQPKFNSVLVEIDDKDSEWGGENTEHSGGKSYNKGKAVAIGECIATEAYPVVPLTIEAQYLGKDILWNEGCEAGTLFEHEGKQYGFIYWSDIRGVKT